MTRPSPAAAADRGPSARITTACAVACGAMVANIYYAQPLIGLIAPELRLSESLGGSIVALTQLGYGAGLLLVVPLADRVENRRLILVTLVLSALALAAVALSAATPSFLLATIVLGFCSAGAQVVVPFAASLAPEAARGRMVGNVMAGLLAGIMLARPAASMAAHLLGWRSVFWAAAAAMLLLAAWLARALPERRPHTAEHYGAILASMGRILAGTRPLQRRALYQGLAFAIFNIFWTAVPLLLTQRFGFTQQGIALFALAGAGGALAAPIAGRLGDRGHVRLGTALALATLALSAGLAGWAGAARALWALLIFAISLDAAVQVNQVLGQRVIYGLAGERRGRINSVYMTVVFVFGAAGSLAAPALYHAGGWWAAALAAAALGLVALAAFATELGGRERVAGPA